MQSWRMHCCATRLGYPKLSSSSWTRTSMPSDPNPEPPRPGPGWNTVRGSATTRARYVQHGWFQEYTTHWGSRMWSRRAARARCCLALAAIDQSAVDAGSWTLAQEYLLELPPPYRSFVQRRPIDPSEQQATRLVGPLISGKSRLVKCHCNLAR